MSNTPGVYLDPAAFDALATALLGADASVDLSSLYLRAEDSEFLRFNQAKLRQADRKSTRLNSSHQ